MLFNRGSFSWNANSLYIQRCGNGWPWLQAVLNPNDVLFKISETSSRDGTLRRRIPLINLWPHSMLLCHVPPSLFCFVLIPGPRILQALPYSVLPTTLGGNTIIFATLQIQGGSERLNNWPKFHSEFVSRTWLESLAEQNMNHPSATVLASSEGVPWELVRNENLRSCPNTEPESTF